MGQRHPPIATLVAALSVVGGGCGGDVVPAQSTAIDVPAQDDSGSDGGDGGSTAPPDEYADGHRELNPCLAYGDADGDCWPAWDDCDDSDAAVNPDAAEICGNMIDDNCDGNAAPCGFGPGEVDLETVASGVLINDFDVYVVGLQALADVSGDGVVDAVLGNFWGRDAKGGLGGSLHVVFGPISGTRNLATADVVVRGDGLGGEGSFGNDGVLDDVDGDGLTDLVVVDEWRGYQHNSDWSYLTFASQVYVWFGPVADLQAEESAQSADLILAAEDREQCISSDVFVGDLTGDGVADLLAQTWGYPGGTTTSGVTVNQTLLLAGPFEGGAIDTSGAVSTFGGFNGEDRLWVKSIVDIDGDGVGDVIGRSTCATGHLIVLPGPIPAGEVDPSQAVVWTNGFDSGAGCGDGTGALALVDNQGAFDLDGDGLNDVAAFNVFLQDATGEQTGAGYVLLGPADDGGPIDDGADMVIIGDGSEAFGVQQAFADFDGDGATDWLVGSDPSDAFPKKRQMGILPGPIETGVHALDEATSVWMPGDSYPNTWAAPLFFDFGRRSFLIEGADSRYQMAVSSWIQLPD